MCIPQKIKIGPFTYRVKKRHVFHDAKQLAGISDATQLEIRLNTDNQGAKAGEEREAEVFLHEVLHATSNVYLASGQELSELQVEQMTKGILDVVRTNRLNLLDTRRG